MLAVWKKVYASGAVSILLTVLLILFGYWNLHNVIRTDYRIETDKEIRTEGYRIALIAAKMTEKEAEAKAKTTGLTLAARIRVLG